MGADHASMARLATTVRPMGLRAGLWKLLARGGGDEPGPAQDPNELVELVTVPLFEAPLMQASLSDHGIDATLEDAFDYVTKALTRSRVLVRRADLVAAHEVITA